MNLADAKQLLTIHDLWRHFRFEGQSSKSCRCPFHEDKSASFSVRADGALWNCFAGCGGGDAVDFFALASGLPQFEACCAFIRLAGGGSHSPPPMARRAPTKADSEAAQAERRKTWPAFEDPLAGANNAAMRESLIELRAVSAGGVRLACERGLLWFTTWKDAPAWIVTDGARVNAQARRMDGQPWRSIDAKAQTLPGSQASRPIGLQESKSFPVVLLMAGGPDLLAAHHWIHAHGREADTAAVAMLGESLTIPADALPHFAGKRVRIMAHADEAGRKAAEKWKDQLDTIGAQVDAADFTGLLMADGSLVKDLNDLTRLRSEDQPQLADMIPTHENSQL